MRVPCQPKKVVPIRKGGLSFSPLSDPIWIISIIRNMNMNLSTYFCTVLKYVKGHTTFNFSSFMTEDKDLCSRILLFQDCVSVWIDFQSFLTEETDVKGIKVRLNLALRFYKRMGEILKKIFLSLSSL